MIDNFEFKENYSFDDLVNIMKLLRSKGGCPWDIEQTHLSIKKNFIEETYEVIEAINKDDKDLLEEELGDVMLQVVFHAQIENEKDTFNIDDVCNGICKKLIKRHPHVFGDVIANTTDKVLKNWDDIKRASKGQSQQSDSMKAVPRELPALMRCDKIQSKAKKAGFDWDSVDGALEKLKEEIEELQTAIRNNDSDNCFEELGDVLFSTVNVSRFLKIDAEESLTSSTDKFLNRYIEVERLAKERNIDMKNSSISQLDKLWDEAKLIVSK